MLGMFHFGFAEIQSGARLESLDCYMVQHDWTYGHPRRLFTWFCKRVGSSPAELLCTLKIWN
jgi:hypothetical protein